MYEIRRNQRDKTKRALQLSDQALKSGSWTRLALAQMFVACPGIERLEAGMRAEHEATMTIMREVVGEYADTLTADFWEDVTEPGNIIEQVIRGICNSDYELCYFSEPNALLRAWIPVRERASAGIPSDIAAERILMVDRKDGALEKAAFAEALRQRVHALVEAPGSNTAPGAQTSFSPDVVTELPPDAATDTESALLPKA